MSHADAIDEFPEPEFLEGAPPKPADCMLALFAHLGGLLFGFIAPGFIAPAILMMMQQDKSEFVVRHARESLNYQLTLLLHATILLIPGLAVFAAFYFADIKSLVAILISLLVALVLLLLLFAVETYFVIRACIAAMKGRDYRYPLTIRLI